VAAHHDVPVETVLAGNGSTELIWAIARSYLRPGDCAVTIGPAYGEYRVASLAMGAEASDLLHPRLAPSEEWVLAALRSYAPRVVWLCHPNNPTGDAFPLEWLSSMMAAHPSTLVVVDEAYLPLAEGLPSALPLVQTGQVVVLRSMTKDAGLAGLRVGYAIAAPTVADVIRRVIPPWSVNALAQAAGIAALEDHEHAARMQQVVAASRRHLVAGLGRLDIFPRPSVANFVLARVGNGTTVAERLLKRGIAVRDCTSFGLPEHVRIGVRSIPDQERLLGALDGMDLG
jgi:histidinol-phosphate aminotransferase